MSKKYLKWSLSVLAVGALVGVGVIVAKSGNEGHGKNSLSGNGVGRGGKTLTAGNGIGRGGKTEGGGGHSGGGKTGTGGAHDG